MGIPGCRSLLLLAFIFGLVQLTAGGTAGGPLVAP